MMNKGVMKRILAFVLAAVMVLGLAGCGKKGGDNPNGELAKQYVYSWEELSIPIDASDYYDISMVSYLNGRIYVIADIYDYNVDNNADGAVDDAVVEDAATPLAASSSIAVPVDPEYSYDNPSGPTEILTLVSFQTDGSDVKTVELMRQTDDGKGYGWFNKLTIGKDGNVYAVWDHYITDETDPDNPGASGPDLLERGGWEPEIV